MVFPVETEERVKRKALNVSSDHLREVVDISRKISQLVSVFVSGDKKMAQELFDDIKKAQNGTAPPSPRPVDGSIVRSRPEGRE